MLSGLQSNLPEAAVKKIILSTQPKILILVDWFTPGYRAGGPIQSCVNVAFALKDQYRIMVFTTDTDYGVSEPYSGITGNQWINNLDKDVQVYYAKQPTLSLHQIKEVLLQEEADFIYLNHLFSPKFVVYPLWLKWKGLIKKKVVVCPRGALYESALSVKRYKKTPFLLLFKWMGLHKIVRFHATNERERKAILDHFPGSEVLIADNLPNSRQPALKMIPKEPGVLKCIFIARIHPIKNLLFLLQALAQVRAQVALTIIGPMEEEMYWQKCQAQIAALPANISMMYKGAIPNNELLPLLQDHHLFILPTTGENFGHAIFESFLAGRPVLISDQTPWLHLEAQKVGWDLPLDQPKAFVDAIESAAAWQQESFDQWATATWQYARNFIDNPVLKQQYLQLFS